MRIATSALAALLASALLASALVPAAHAGTGRAVAESDPAHDVRAAKHATAAQRGTVDLLSLSYGLASGGPLTIDVSVRTLAATRGNQFLDTEMKVEGLVVTVSGEVGKKALHFFDGDHYYTCKGAVQSVRRSTIHQVVPHHCLSMPGLATYETTSLLARNNGTSIATDHGRRISFAAG